MRLLEVEARWLFWGNASAGVFHWLSAIAALIVSLVRSDDVYKAIITLTTLEDIGGGTIGPVLRVLGSYKLTWTLVTVPVLTGLFHLTLAFVPYFRRDYERMVLSTERGGMGFNMYRWVEYSLSASLVTWNIAQVSGLCDLFVLLSLVGMNIWMQIVGGLGHELHNRGKQPGCKVDWWLFASGFLPHALTWGFIWPAFVLAVRSSTDGVPVFVWLLVIGLFVQYTLFVVPLWFHSAGWLFTSNQNYELAYIVLSVVSKFWMDWTVILGAVL